MKFHDYRRVGIPAFGLDLRNSRDVEELYARIKCCAAGVCMIAAAPWDARRRSAVVCIFASSHWMAGHDACVTQRQAASIDDAIAHANVDELTALHQSQVRAARMVQYLDDCADQLCRRSCVAPPKDSR